MKQKVLNWIQKFNTFCLLDNQQYQIQPHTQEFIAGAGIKRRINAGGENALDLLQQFNDQKRTWLFGHLAYELNTRAGQSAHHDDHIQFPDLFFFEPDIIIRVNENEMTIEAQDPLDIFENIDSMPVDRPVKLQTVPAICNRLSKDEYISIIRQLQQHILRGDCYEINFCQEFYAEKTIVDPVEVYRKLIAVSPNPFSALYRMDDKWLICASPERFLQRSGNRIISQPIKGTSRRILTDRQQDELMKQRLSNSQKDKSENVMVVDLVRNDLAKICKEGTVQVEELYGVYSFPQVHQMISTVTGELKKQISFADIIRATFPMGSMSGAPKMRVMELIAQYEKTKRGIFSGCLGYVSPSGDFDLNVVIRSIMYNALTGYLSFQAGSGITFYSNAEQEWEECLLKAEAIKTTLS